MPDPTLLCELVPVPVLMVTSGLDVRHANAAARQHWGPDVVGRPLVQVLEDDEESLREVVRTLLRTSTPVPAGVRVREGADGPSVAQVVGCRVADDPPTAAMRFDLERAGRFAALTETVDRMNAEIARRREVESQLQTLLTTTIADLESANAVLRRFAGGVAHDLKSPLATLAGFAEFVVTHGEALGDLQPVVERMQEVSRRAIGLVDDLLAEAMTVASSDAPVAVDVRDVLDEVRALLGDDLDGHRLTSSEDLPVVEARTGALRQVLLNLVVNAMVHHGPGGAAIHVDASRDGSMWTIRVHDDGPGIATEDRERVFDEGVRLDERTPGTGYGLAHCRRIIEGLGGRLWFADPNGSAGAVACVSLPAPA